MVWVSHPDAIRSASVKPEQLRRASALGFPIPRTCFSNDPVYIDAFFEACGGPERVVYKPYNPMMFTLPGDKRLGVVYTTRLTSRATDRLAEVRWCPGIFQEWIPKRRDIRVTVFDRAVYAVGIASQDHDSTRDDWRAYPWANSDEFPLHAPMTLDDEISRRCVELVQSYDLKFGAIDLVESVTGETLFLELNPNGQWAWVEERTGLPMTSALVDTLQGKLPISIV